MITTTMIRLIHCCAVAFMLVSAPGLAQTTDDPFPTPITEQAEALHVGIEEFAVLPDFMGASARMMLLVDEPVAGRLFVNDMHGVLYAVSHDGQTVTRYLDLNAPTWYINVQFAGFERGFQSFALHPQFGQRGTPGFGKLYVYTDTGDQIPPPDFTAGGGNDTHDTVLIEWTSVDPALPHYAGTRPRELIRVEQPFPNHNGGQIGFNPTAQPGDSDFGLLYIGSADGGAGGDPLNVSQDLASVFGKILRIDPLGTNSRNGTYGIPGDNPFAADGDPDTLDEIYAYGVRNPQRFAWDPQDGRLFLADIGQETVEEVSLVTPGANLGWNEWEGSYLFAGREVDLANPRSALGVTYPVVEYGQDDPLFQPGSAVTGLVVSRENPIPQLQNVVLFGDNPSGEVFAVDADMDPVGGQNAIRRVLFRHEGDLKTLLELIRDKNADQGRPRAPRADLRFGSGSDGQIFLLNKRDGVIRRLVP